MIGDSIDMDYEEYICKDSDGNILISIDKTDESSLNDNPLLTHCLAVIRVGNDYLLGRNKWRNRYEVFGGCLEKGETARECIIRECTEELGLDSFDITYIGAMKFLLQPDYFSKEERVEIGGLFGITLPDADPAKLYDMVKDKEEITEIALYGKVKGHEPIAGIDEKLLEFFGNIET